MRADACPHCGVNLIGAPIPEQHRQMYGKATHFRREILVEIPGAYDGGLFYRCPSCAGTWHRWPEGHYLRAVAEQHMTPPAERAA